MRRPSGGCAPRWWACARPAAGVAVGGWLRCTLLSAPGACPRCAEFPTHRCPPCGVHFDEVTCLLSSSLWVVLHCACLRHLDFGDTVTKIRVRPLLRGLGVRTKESCLEAAMWHACIHVHSRRCQGMPYSQKNFFPVHTSPLKPIVRELFESGSGMHI